MRNTHVQRMNFDNWMTLSGGRGARHSSLGSLDDHWTSGHRKRPWDPQLLIGRGVRGLRLCRSGGSVAFGGFRSLNCPHRSDCLYCHLPASLQFQNCACIDQCTAPHFFRTPMLRSLSDCACTDECAPLHFSDGAGTDVCI